jgi:hypothetical protein
MFDARRMQKRQHVTTDNDHSIPPVQKKPLFFRKLFQFLPTTADTLTYGLGEYWWPRFYRRVWMYLWDRNYGANGH